jgi:cyclopropane fatty-acyl-phospholipid synthase-like methyltransferase
MAHRVLTNSEEVREYEQYLDDGWPARTDVMQHLCARLASSGANGLRVLELACGPGALADVLLKSAPIAEYVGVDISEASVAFAEERTAGSDAEVKLLAADLNDGGWLGEVGENYDAIVSMQSIHDLGSEAEVARIFRVVGKLLRPGGRFVYADLLRSPSDAPDANPGRFSVDQHLTLLEEASLVSAVCTLQTDGFGCFEAHATHAA